LEDMGLISREKFRSRGGAILEYLLVAVEEEPIRDFISGLDAGSLFSSLGAVVPLLRELKPGEVLTEEDLPTGLKLYELLRENKADLASRLAAVFWQGPGQENLATFFPSDGSGLFVSASGEKVEKVINSFREREIKSDYQSFITPEKFTEEHGDRVLDFIADNLPSILEGKIKDTVSGSLLRLSEEEIRSTLENFMGRELKPITYFGAFLGLFAGSFLHLGTEMASVSLPVFLDFLLVFTVYGFVGYLTNVIALKMIFQPYEEKTMFGLRLPFTPGVVARNKKRFSTTMGGFVEEELLNSDAVSELLAGKEKEITGRLLDFLIADNYRLLRDQIGKRKEKLAGKVVEFIFSRLEQEREAAAGELKLLIEKFPLDRMELGDDLFTALGQQDFTSSLDSIMIKEILGSASNTGLPPGVLERLYTVLENRSESKLKDLLPASRSEKIKEEMISFLQEQVLTPEVRNIIFSRLETVLAEFIAERLPAFLEKNADRILGLLYERGLDELHQRRGEIAGLIMDFIEKDFGILRRKVFEFLAEDELEAFLDVFFAGELPEFLEAKKPALKEILLNFSRDLDREFVREIISDKRELIDSLWEEIAGGELFREFIAVVSGRLLDLKVGDLIVHFSAEDLKAVFAAAEEDGVVCQLLDNLLENFSFRELLESLNLKPLNNLWREQKEEYLQAFMAGLQKEMEGKNAGYLLHSEMLEKDLSHLLGQIAGKREIRERLTELITSGIEKFTVELEQHFQDNGPEEFVEIILRGVLRSLRGHISELFTVIDFQGITDREIRQMNPREIEELFFSFAGRYFVRLKRYGWLGGGIGVLTEIISLLM
ncbi:MAG: DUF445 family protein, partial [Halanaerobiales bacterium]